MQGSPVSMDTSNSFTVSPPQAASSDVPCAIAHNRMAVHLPPFFPLISSSALPCPALPLRFLSLQMPDQSMLPKLPRPTPQATSRPHSSLLHHHRSTAEEAFPRLHRHRHRHIQKPPHQPSFLPSRPNSTACSILNHFRSRFVRSAWQVELRPM